MSSLLIFQTTTIEVLEKMIEKRVRVNNMKNTDEIFGQKFIYICYHTFIQIGSIIKNKITVRNKTYEIPEINRDIIRENNIEYLRRNLLDSKIEYFPNESEIKEEKGAQSIYHQPEYPITITNYKICGFIKITKTRDLSVSLNNIDRFRTVFSAIYNDLIIHKYNPGIVPINLDGLNCLFI